MAQPVSALPWHSFWQNVGDHIILAGRHHDKIQDACQQLQATGAKTVSMVQDIADEAQLDRLAQTPEPVDSIVVTADSQAPGGAFTALDLKGAKQAFDTRFWGSLAVARHLSGKIKPGGTLTLTSGFLARRIVPGTLVKTTMNAALEAAVKMLAKELSPLRVRLTPFMFNRRLKLSGWELRPILIPKQMGRV